MRTQQQIREQPDRVPRDEISERTGFDKGETFTSEAQVMVYFMPSEQSRMFGDEAVTDPSILAAWASAVVQHRWHCAFTRKATT